MRFKWWNNRVFRTMFSVTGVIVISKLLGFAKQVLIASAFGATIETDLISLSEGLIGNVKYLIVHVLLTAFISAYIQTKERNEGDERSFSTNVMLAASLITLPIILAAMLAGPWLARLLAPSYDAALTARLAGYLRLFAPTLLLFVWMALFQAVLNANKRFLPGQLEGLNQSLIQIGLILLLAGMFGVRVLIISFFAATIWNTIYLCVLARRYFGRPTVSPFRDPAIPTLAKMMAPLLVGYSLVYVNQQVDKILASGLAAGTVTAMGYASTLSNLIVTVIVAIGSILFPYIAEHIARGEQERAAELSVLSALIMLIVILPINILTVMCAKDIVSIVYGHGAFTGESVEIAALALAGYGFGGIGLVLREVFSRFQYSYQDTKWPMVNSSIGILCNIALSIALCPVWGAFGVAFASSVSVVICGVLNMYTARRKNSQLGYGLIYHHVPRMIVAGLICVLIALFGMNMTVTWKPIWRFTLITALGLIGYYAVTGPVLLRCLRHIRPT